MDKSVELQAQSFFDALSGAVDARQVSKLVPFFHIPTIFVEEGVKNACVTTDQLQSQLSHYLENAALSEPYHHNPQVLQVLKLSSSIYFVQVKWQWLSDQSDAVMSERQSSYTIQSDADGGFTIVVSVVDGE